MALLAEAESVAATARTQATWTVRVSLALSDDDLRSYVRDCLRSRVDIFVVNDVTAPPDVRADFMISDRMAREVAVPLLLLADDQNVSADLLHCGSSMSPRVEVLLAPFNARRLLEAIDRLLGPPG